jgi:hypothetical protein
MTLGGIALQERENKVLIWGQKRITATGYSRCSIHPDADWPRRVSTDLPTIRFGSCQPFERYRRLACLAIAAIQTYVRSAIVTTCTTRRSSSEIAAWVSFKPRNHSRADRSPSYRQNSPEAPSALRAISHNLWAY